MGVKGNALSLIPLCIMLAVIICIFIRIDYPVFQDTSGKIKNFFTGVSFRRVFVDFRSVLTKILRGKYVFLSFHMASYQE